MRHPFEYISALARRRLFWLSLAGTLIMAEVLSAIAGGFASKQRPYGRSYGVVAFEFAGTPAGAGDMLTAWGPDGIRAAKWNTWLDYLFMPAYANLFALAVLWAAAGAKGSRITSLGRILAWGQWLAAGFDAVENIGLLVTLYSGPSIPWPELSWGCATVKFLLLGLGLAFILARLPFRIGGYRRKRAVHPVQSI